MFPSTLYYGDLAITLSPTRPYGCSIFPLGVYEHLHGGDKINTIEVLKRVMCMHYFTKQVVSFYISIPAYHLHIKNGQACVPIMLVRAGCMSWPDLALFCIGRYHRFSRPPISSMET